ncbi:MAG: YebC/PmpR family DNA-binding transcriptional regulator [Acidobacteriota bacterium]|nr:YebC/PmpR family DNA-binding transcriptional regulator [Acidobacteriota bacterium]
MAGHSKWAQIKRKKAVTDARRGKLWTKLLKELTVAARLGGADPAGNPRLRVGIQEARAANVPSENIERAVNRGAGLLDGVTYEELTYEGYGPGGVAILIEAMTDNKNRTVSELRHLLSKSGGNLGENGCVAWMFVKRGYFVLEKDALDEDELMELALAVGAEDAVVEDEVYELYSAPEDYAAVRDELEQRQIAVSSQALAMLPKSEVELDLETTARVLRLVDALEDQEDVQNVWSNLNVSEEAMAALEEA